MATGIGFGVYRWSADALSDPLIAVIVTGLLYVVLLPLVLVRDQHGRHP